MKLKSKKYVNYEGPVFDLTVENTHSYNIEGLAVHNSAAGSLVAFLSGITTIDPIKYDLIFERFHNSEKKSFPDIDSDFSNPGLVKEYLKKKYGEDRVASISNLTTLSPKVVIKDVARSLELGGDKSSAFKISNHITSIMPDAKTVEEAVKMSKEFAAAMKQYPKLYEFACKLQGLTRNWSVHAAGVIISDRPLYETVPLRIDYETGLVVSQWEKTRCEENGLIKMDILGVKTLTVIDDAFDLIAKTEGDKILIDDIPLDDEDTFKMIGRGETSGVFQLESSLTPLCIKIKPTDIRGISDINALGRPSCSASQREDYIQRRLGFEPIKFRDETLRNALEKTYGVSLYEEGMMTIAKDCAGWDLNQADALRKITKLKGRDPGMVLRTENSFIQDTMDKHQLSYKKAKEIWENEIEPFGAYGFNAAHSISYSHISYYTAWLRCHYPTQFMCALLNSEKPTEDKAIEYIHECANMNIKITPPNINSSKTNYVVLEPGKIATGLMAMKGVGEKAIEHILELQPFKNIEDFFLRTNSRIVNKRVIQAMAKAGAFEPFDRTRKDIHDNYEKYRVYINKILKEAEKSKEKAEEIKSENKFESIKLPTYESEEWNRKEFLLAEREILGRTISGSLHEVFAGFFRANSSVTPLRMVKNMEAGDRVKIEVIINSKIKEFTIKKGKSIGKKFAKYLIEDSDGSTGELIVWQNDYEKYNHILKEGLPLKAICKVDVYMEQKGLSLAILEGVLGKEI